MVQPVVTGVVSGILTAIALLLFKRLWDVVVLPWYRAIVYRGVNVSGTWSNEITFGNGLSQKLLAHLRQSGHSVVGDLTILKFRNVELSETKSLRLIGELRDRLLLASISPKSEKEIAAACLLLEVVGDANRMRGATTWYDAGSAEVSMRDVEWTRVD